MDPKDDVIDDNEVDFSAIERTDVNQEERPAPKPKDDPVPDDDSDEPPKEDDDESDEAWGKVAADAPKADEKPEEKPDTSKEEDEHGKGMVPSHRVREIREKADAEILRWKSRAEELESKLPETQQIEERIRTTLTSDPDLTQGRAALSALDQLVREASDPDQTKAATARQILQQHGIVSSETYQAARQDIALSVREREREIRDGIKGEHQRKIQDAQAAKDSAANAMVAKYQGVISASKIPEVTKAAARIAANAERISPSIRQWMLESEDAAEITMAIGGSASLFKELEGMGKGQLSPSQLAKAVRKVDAVIAKQASRRPQARQEEEDELEPVQRAPQAPRPSGTQRRKAYVESRSGEIEF